MRQSSEKNTADSILQQLEIRLYQAADLAGKRYISRVATEIDPNRVLGISVPVLRKIEKDLSCQERRALLCGSHLYYEEELLAVLVCCSIRDVQQAWRALQTVKPVFYTWSLTDTCTMPYIPDSILLDWAQHMLEGNTPYEQRLGIVWILKRIFRGPLDMEIIQKALSVPSEEKAVMMAKAWLMCEGMIHQPDVFEELIVSFPDKKVQHMAIRKCLDSFRISDSRKDQLTGRTGYRRSIASSEKSRKNAQPVTVQSSVSEEQFSGQKKMKS